MAKVDLYKFEDLLDCAMSIGYGYLEAHNILTNDCVLPMDGNGTRSIHIGEYKLEDNYYHCSEDTIKILQAFFKQEGLEEFVISI